jgi:replicative DNA helicase
MHNRPCYEVGFSGGEAIVADAEHRWVTWDRNTRKAYDDANPGLRAYPSDWPSWSSARKAVTPRTTADIAATVRAGDEHNHAIPATQPLALPDADLPLDPYVLGYLLGDGDTAGSGRVACDAQDRKWLIEAFRDAGYVAREHSDDGHFGVPGIAQAWRSLGLDDGKHIPAAYLRASVTQRMALVQGLVDSDGHVDSHGAYRFTSTSRRLIDGFVELVASLGCVPQARHRRGRVRAGVVCADSWDVIVPTGFPLARLPRKAVHARTVWNREHCSRYVTAARSVESVPVRCVQVDSPDHLYLAGRSMIPTHNSTLALDVARAASIKHGLTTVMFSLEMTRNEITMRLLSAEGRIPLHHMRNGHMSDDDWQRLARKMGEVSSAPLFIDDSPNMTMTEIRAKARRLKQRNDLRMVVLDYIQLMTSGKKVESRQVEVSEFSRQLKLLAKELDVPVVALSQLNRGAEQRSDKRPMLSDLRESGCLTADTRLMRADNGGEISLGELVASQARNIAVWALDDRLKLVPRTLTHAFPSGVKEVLRLRFASGREIKATASHRFLTYGGWRALGDLVVGDRLGTIRHLPAPLQPAAMDDDEVVLSAQQLVAAPVFGAPNAQVGLFLRQLWAAGGSVDWPRGASCADVSCATSSRRLADQVASLLLRFDIYARVSRVPGREAYHVTIDGVEHQLRFLDQIGVHGVRGDAAREIAGRLRASRPAPELDTVPEAVWASVKAALERRPVAVGQSAPRRLDAVTSILDDGGLELQAANDVYWDTIAGIESIGAQEVYDATVLGLHNFVADGVAAHNSLEQDADVVILLHRDDAYEKESLRPGEADLIVAKHRNGPTKDVVVAFQGHYSRFVDMAHG